MDDNFHTNGDDINIEYQDEYNKNAKPGDMVLYPLTVSVSKAKKAVKAMKVVAVLTIISGAAMCLQQSFVSGVLTILSGVKLKTSADTMSSVVNGSGSYREELLAEDLLGYFRYKGIALVISLGSAIFLVLLNFGMIFAGLESL